MRNKPAQIWIRKLEIVRSDFGEIVTVGEEGSKKGLSNEAEWKIFTNTERCFSLLVT